MASTGKRGSALPAQPAPSSALGAARRGERNGGVRGTERRGAGNGAATGNPKNPQSPTAGLKSGSCGFATRVLVSLSCFLFFSFFFYCSLRWQIRLLFPLRGGEGDSKEGREVRSPRYRELRLQLIIWRPEQHTFWWWEIMAVARAER